MKTGLFFGSFNPVHNGHLEIAKFMAESTDLDEVWFIVSPQNPMKPVDALLQDVYRLELVKIAIEGYEKLKVSDVEFHLPRPSYTIQTLKFLSEKFPGKNFVLIMGSDSLESFARWKDYEQILNDHEIYVYPRKNHDGGKLKSHRKVIMTNAPFMEISATHVRKAIKENKDVKNHLPSKVWKAIEEKEFYKK
jgi:nicotinate-nucleotide adenylyltransferase